MKIKLSDDISIDLDKAIESRILVQANSGGGKSYTLRRFIEQTFGKKQIIILDPEGEFGNLRSKFDFVYIGEGGDAPAEPRSAALLARRLMETKANAIIDIYELGSKRSEFVKNFMDAMVNMPKELWTDCFIILDEAHKFAPEKGQGESVALSSVVDMASLGRKRGYCLVPATQRPSKLSKDVVAECNNKLIGRASLDIDRKRSAEELGFHTKEEILSLRDLQPGEFYVFGPAISREVVKTTIGDVEVKPPKRGTGRSIKIAPPTAKVKAILKQLADLPQEAEKELKTVAELKAEIIRLKRIPVPVPAVPAAMGVSQWRAYGQERGYYEYFEKQIVEARDKEWEKRVEVERGGWSRQSAGYVKAFKDIEAALVRAGNSSEIIRSAIPPKPLPVVIDLKKDIPPLPKTVQVEPINLSTEAISKGELAVLKALAQYPQGVTRPHLTVMTTYKKSTRDRYINYLQQKGLVEVNGAYVLATEAGALALGDDFQPLPTGQELIDHYEKTLPAGEWKLLEVMLEFGNAGTHRDYLTERTGFQKSTRDRYINYLQARGLVEAIGAGLVRASEFLIV